MIGGSFPLFARRALSAGGRYSPIARGARREPRRRGLRTYSGGTRRSEPREQKTNRSSSFVSTSPTRTFVSAFLCVFAPLRRRFSFQRPTYTTASTAQQPSPALPTITG